MTNLPPKSLKNLTGTQLVTLWNIWDKIWLTFAYTTPSKPLTMGLQIFRTFSEKVPSFNWGSCAISLVGNKLLVMKKLGIYASNSEKLVFTRWRAYKKILNSNNYFRYGFLKGTPIVFYMTPSYRYKIDCWKVILAFITAV